MAASWDHDLRFDEEARSFLQTVSLQAAKVLERIRLTERENAAVKRGQAISELGEQWRWPRLERTPSRGWPTALAWWPARRAPTWRCATTASSSSPTARGSTVRSPSGTRSRRSTTHCPTAPDQREMVIVTNRDEYVRRFPAVRDSLDDAGVQAAVCIPMRDSEADVFGAIGLGWQSPQHFDAADLARFRTLGSVAARTLERTRLRQELHCALHGVALRSSASSPPPSRMPGIELAAHYQPASSEVGMGGDWYNTVALDDGTLVIGVGDVVGHGVEAVATMAQLQHLVTGLLRSGVRLDRVLSQVNAMTTRGTLATAQILHVDRRGRLGDVNAGHPGLPPPPERRGHDAERIGAAAAGGGGRSGVAQLRRSGAGLDAAGLHGRPHRTTSRVDHGGIERLAAILADVDPGRPLADVLPGIVDEAQGRGDDVSDVNDDIAATRPPPALTPHRSPEHTGSRLLRRVDAEPSGLGRRFWRTLLCRARRTRRS